MPSSDGVEHDVVEHNSETPGGSNEGNPDGSGDGSGGLSKSDKRLRNRMINMFGPMYDKPENFPDKGEYLKGMKDTKGFRLDGAFKILKAEARSRFMKWYVLGIVDKVSSWVGTQLMKHVKLSSNKVMNELVKALDTDSKTLAQTLHAKVISGEQTRKEARASVYAPKDFTKLSKRISKNLFKKINYKRAPALVLDVGPSKFKAANTIRYIISLVYAGLRYPLPRSKTKPPAPVKDDTYSNMLILESPEDVTLFHNTLAKATVYRITRVIAETAVGNLLTKPDSNIYNQVKEAIDDEKSYLEVQSAVLLSIQTVKDVGYNGVEALQLSVLTNSFNNVFKRGVMKAVAAAYQDIKGGGKLKRKEIVAIKRAHLYKDRGKHEFVQRGDGLGLVPYRIKYYRHEVGVDHDGNVKFRKLKRNNKFVAINSKKVKIADVCPRLATFNILENGEWEAKEGEDDPPVPIPDTEYNQFRHKCLPSTRFPNARVHRILHADDSGVINFFPVERKGQVRMLDSEGVALPTTRANAGPGTGAVFVPIPDTANELKTLPRQIGLVVFNKKYKNEFAKALKDFYTLVENDNLTEALWNTLGVTDRTEKHVLAFFITSTWLRPLYRDYSVDADDTDNIAIRYWKTLVLISCARTAVKKSRAAVEKIVESRLVSIWKNAKNINSDEAADIVENINNIVISCIDPNFEFGNLLGEGDDDEHDEMHSLFGSNSKNDEGDGDDEGEGDDDGDDEGEGDDDGDDEGEGDDDGDDEGGGGSGGSGGGGGSGSGGGGGSGSGGGGGSGGGEPVVFPLTLANFNFGYEGELPNSLQEDWDARKLWDILKKATSFNAYSDDTQTITITVNMSKVPLKKLKSTLDSDQFCKAFIASFDPKPHVSSAKCIVQSKGIDGQLYACASLQAYLGKRKKTLAVKHFKEVTWPHNKATVGDHRTALDVNTFFDLALWCGFVGADKHLHAARRTLYIAMLLMKLSGKTQYFMEISGDTLQSSRTLFTKVYKKIGAKCGFGFDNSDRAFPIDDSDKFLYGFGSIDDALAKIRAAISK